MDKLSLSGTQFYFSLLACDPTKPIYHVTAIKDSYRDEFYTNQPQFYTGYDTIVFELASTTNIRSSLFILHQKYDCKSSLMHHHFMTLYNETTKADKESSQSEK